jgi:tetratricopeptide (TPR) repeat protein
MATAAVIGPYFFSRYLLYFRFVFGYFLRNFEREADLYVFSALGTAEPLINAFKKLVWLIGDFGQRANWHHYNIPQRIDYLRKCIGNPALIHRHRRKVKAALLIFIICVFSLVLLGSRLNTANLQQSLNNRFLIKVMENYCREHPDEVNAFISLGSLYFEEQQLKPTRNCFETALALDRKQPELLNNYAWLLLTAEDPKIRNIEQGYRLAKEAAAMSLRLKKKLRLKIRRKQCSTKMGGCRRHFTVTLDRRLSGLTMHRGPRHG